MPPRSTRCLWISTTSADPADTVPALDEAPVSRGGDLWHLGDHRLLCGDARSRSDVDRLVGIARARMAFLDPPYNVRIADVQGRGRIKHPEFAHASGEMTTAQYVTFLEQALANAAWATAEGSVHYVCSDWRHFTDLGVAARSVYGAMLNVCIWAKTNAGQGSFYRSQHELIGVFRVGDQPHQNNVELGRHGRNRSNLWSYPGVVGFGAGRAELLRMHPTTKPVAMIADAMRDCTSKGDAVLDTFVGSGSTIMAAEKVGRRAYAIDCEPRYIDVTIHRWEKFTKAEAVLDGDGRTFAEIRTDAYPARRAPFRRPGRRQHRNAIGRSRAGRSQDSGDWSALCHEVPVTPAKAGRR